MSVFVCRPQISLVFFSNHISDITTLSIASQVREPPIDVRVLVSSHLISPKETTFERADFTIQLSMFVTEEKERQMFIIFFLSSFCQLLSPRFQAMAGWERADHESSHQPA